MNEVVKSDKMLDPGQISVSGKISYEGKSSHDLKQEKENPINNSAKVLFGVSKTFTPKQKHPLKSRLSSHILQLFIKNFQNYEGYWDDSKFSTLAKSAGLSKKQLNKWLWDRNKRVKDTLKKKKIIYPGCIF